MSEPSRSRILLVTRNLPPLVGGMERLNWHMAEELARHADVRVVGPVGSAALAPAGVAVEEVPLSPLPRFLLGACLKAWRIARRWKPDVVLAGSGLTAPMAWWAARACGARAAVYVHGLDMALRKPLYRALWLPAIRRMDCVIANSGPTRQLALDAGVQAARIGIVHPGVDVPAAETGVAEAARFRAGEGLEGRAVLLSVGRLSQRKGLREFVADVLPDVVAARPGTMLLVVGDSPNQALHAQAQTPQSIQAEADCHGVGGNIRFLGVITDRAHLAAVYRSADVHAFPVRQIPGDPEGFGMVAVEAAAHELPTVAYATGGIVEAVDDGRSGRLVPPGDAKAMVAAILETLDRRDALRASCRAFAAGKAWPVFGEQVRRLLFPSA